jgi:acetylornithine deacetylase
MVSTEAAVLRWIDAHQDELVHLLRRLVAVPSVVGSEAACQQQVAELLAGQCDRLDVWEPDRTWLEAHPAYFQRGVGFEGRPNVVATLRGSGGGRSLIVNAHVDVVDPGPAEAWPHPPWSGAITDGRLHGRGAIDDKAGLAAMIFVARGLAAVGRPLRGDLILQSVVDEEWGGGGTLATLERGYRADGAIVFEPTAFEVCPASRGGMAFRVTVQGKGAHPVRSYEGVSALEKALPLIPALRALETARQDRLRTPLFADHPIFAPIVIGTISADVLPSKVPEACIFQGLYGYAPEEAYPAARKELEEAVTAAAAGDPWLRDHPPAVTWLGLNKEGAQIPADHPLVGTLADAFRTAAGRPARIAGFPAGCDLPFLVRYAGVPGVVFGPGHPTVAHSSSEHIQVADLLTTARVLALAVLAWCGTA